MCLITNQLQPKIAEEDIIIYKIFDRDGKSFLRGYEYKPDVLYTTTITEEKDEWLGVDNLDLVVLDELYPDWRSKPGNLKCFSEGFHGLTNFKRSYDFTDSLYKAYKVYKAIIPKGSEYYTNPSGCVISNQIIIKEEITQFSQEQ